MTLRRQHRRLQQPPKMRKFSPQFPELVVSQSVRFNGLDTLSFNCVQTHVQFQQQCVFVVSGKYVSLWDSGESA